MNRLTLATSRYCGVIVAVSLLLGGCEALLEKVAPDSEPTAQVESAVTATLPLPAVPPATSVPTPTGTSAPAPTTAASAPAPGGVPALSRDALDVEKIKASKNAKYAGDDALKAKDLPKAEREYRRALTIDAGNIFARYQLASTLVQAGKASDGVALLVPLKEEGCPVCLERLLSATQDVAFSAVHKDPAFVALTQDAHKPLLTLSLVAEHMVKWFMKTQEKALPDDKYLDPRALIVIEDRTTDAKQRYVRLHGSKEFRRHVKEAYPLGIYPGGPRTCANGCCEFAGTPILGVHLKRMCFKTTGMAAVNLYNIVIEGDPGASFPG